MEECKAIAVRDHLDVGEVRSQVNLIQNIMKEVMKEGEHYGKIPGCGDKPALLKPGAEKLNLTFRMSPTYEIERIDFPSGHREYIVTCTLKTIGSDIVLGQGVGSCSSMESKYRFQTGPKESTGKPVPTEYWNIRKSDPAKAQALLGGKGFGTVKNDAGQWVISIQGEKIENPNPADQFNTILKMAKKRAHVDAVLTVTAASDIFTQDIEDFVDVTQKNNETVVNIKPEQSPEIYYYIANLRDMNKLEKAEKFLGKRSSEWTEEDINKIEAAKAKAKKSSPESPTIDDQSKPDTNDQVTDEITTDSLVERFKNISDQQEYDKLCHQIGDMFESGLPMDIDTLDIAQEEARKRIFGNDS